MCGIGLLLLSEKKKSETTVGSRETLKRNEEDELKTESQSSTQNPLDSEIETQFHLSVKWNSYSPPKSSNQEQSKTNSCLLNI